LDSHLPPADILKACAAEGYRWRERKLGPVLTIHLFLLQILHLNTAIVHLRHLICQPLNPAAYCKARMRLPLKVLERLLYQSASSLRQQLDRRLGEDLSCWRGHRTLLVDGTGTITPDTPPLQKEFGQPPGTRPGCALPVPKVLGLFDAMTGLILQVTAFAGMVHESARLTTLHPFIEAGDLLVGDRAYCSFAHLAMLAARQVHALLRLHQSSRVSFRPHRPHFDRRKSPAGRKRQKGRPRSKFVRRLQRYDQIVRWIKPEFRRKNSAWMSREQYDRLPEELELRELRYWIVRPGSRTRVVTLITTLLDPALYPKDSLAELYGLRWRVETHLRNLKITLKMRRLKCQKEQGVRKELIAYALVYNLVHAVMARAAAAQQTTPDRISFIDVLRWLWTAQPDKIPLFVVNPVREGRSEPRAVKDYQTKFPGFPKPRKIIKEQMQKKCGVK
jgi:hypothetical protein